MLLEILLACATVASAAPSVLQERQTGQTFSASFTHYGGCGAGTAACKIGGGYTAAVSQNFFGVGSGAGAGPACGTCFSISSPQTGTPPITVKVTDLCPADQFNPLCGSAMIADINLDLCDDDGASGAFFGNGPGQVSGTATVVPC